jgi:hypothetical protein
MRFTTIAFTACWALVSLTGTLTIAWGGMLPGTCSSGSVHDMRVFASTNIDPLGRGSCLYCHTPHNSDGAGTPLWNKEHIPTDSSGWKPYVWATPTNKGIAITDPLQGPTRLCMSCHDGVTAIDQHGGALPNGGTGFMSLEAAVGRNKDLTDDHPIGFSYSEAVSRRNNSVSQELVDPSQAFATGITISEKAGSYNNVIRNGKRAIKDVLYGGDIVTCSSCHDVHNCNNAIPDPGHYYNYLVWAKEENSLLCLSCHIK